MCVVRSVQTHLCKCFGRWISEKTGEDHNAFKTKLRTKRTRKIWYELNTCKLNITTMHCPPTNWKFLRVRREFWLVLCVSCPQNKFMYLLSKAVCVIFVQIDVFPQRMYIHSGREKLHKSACNSVQLFFFVNSNS